MVPGKYDITIYRGSTFEIGIGAENSVGVAIDFAAVYDSMRLQIRPSWSKKQSATPPGALLELTTANGGIVVATTLITLYITAAATAALTFNEGQYDLELIIDAATGPPAVAQKVHKLLSGFVKVVGEVTV